jgi:hypothetical protein
VKCPLKGRRTRGRVPASAPYPSSLAERSLRRQIPKVGARCVNHARRDLCGGGVRRTAHPHRDRPAAAFLRSPGSWDGVKSKTPKPHFTAAIHALGRSHSYQKCPKEGVKCRPVPSRSVLNSGFRFRTRTVFETLSLHINCFCLQAVWQRTCSEFSPGKALINKERESGL